MSYRKVMFKEYDTAACVASGLLELSKYVEGADKARYQMWAYKILDALFHRNITP